MPRVPAVALAFAVLALSACTGCAHRAEPAAGGAVSSAGPVTTATAAGGTGFVLRSYRLEDDGTGHFGGSLDVSNTGANTGTVSFTLTIRAGGQPAGTATGVLDSVASGRSVTVPLHSQDRFRPGPYTVHFARDV